MRGPARDGVLAGVPPWWLQDQAVQALRYLVSVLEARTMTNPRHIAPLGRETICSACRQGTMLLYPVVDRAGNITGYERRCSFCHKREGAF